MLRTLKTLAVPLMAVTGLFVAALMTQASVAAVADARVSFPNAGIFEADNKAFAAALTGKMLTLRSALGRLPTGADMVRDEDLPAATRDKDAERIDAMIVEAVKSGAAAQSRSLVATQPYAFWMTSLDVADSPARKLLGLDRMPVTLTQLFPGVSEQHVRLPFGAGHAIVSVLTLGGLDADPVDGYRCLAVANSVNAQACPAAALVFDARGALQRIKIFPADAIAVAGEQGYEAKLTEAGALTLTPLVNGVTHSGKRWRPVSVEIGPAP
mgnify:CR=1 FL=1